MDNLASYNVAVARSQEHISWPDFSRLSSATVQRQPDAETFHVLSGARSGLECGNNRTGSNTINTNAFGCELCGKSTSKCQDSAFGGAVVDYEK